MRFGIRIPSVKKMIRARTTGKIVRMVKSISPVYGKRGMGYINNPRKAIYNKAYNKTTFSIIDLIKKLLKGG